MAVAACVWFLRSFLLCSSFLVVVVLPLTFAVSDSDVVALLKLKKSFTNAGGLGSWLPAGSGSAPCNKDRPWKGLLCYNGVVNGLRLEGMGLSGKIDVDALVEMESLRSFSVMNNSFSGNIPEINRLGALKALFLSGNRFSGEIPSDYFAKMGSLKKVWLSGNKFTGKIPVSLAQCSHLIDLRLENNQFTGNIPDFNNQPLKSINLSNNKLEGEIPSSLSKFKANAFAGNPGLCGEQVGVNCNVHGGHDKHDTKKIIAASVTLGLMLLSVIIFFAIRWRKKKRQQDRHVTERGSSNEAAVEVQVSLPTMVEVSRKSNVSSNHSGGFNHGRVSGGAVPELVMVNDEKGVFGLPDLMKAAAEVLGNGAMGCSYKATMANGVAVVVKRIKEMNALGKEGFDAEVKMLGNLRHPNVLTPIAYHYRREEKLFVYEYLANGSLLYQLHGDRGTSGAELDWPARLKIVQGITKGLHYLHAELAHLEVPHGNLKSSNVLLGPDNHPFLSDYGFCPLLNIDDLESLFAYKTPEAVNHGNVSPKSDVYCLGIIILEILTGKLPSQYRSNGEAGSDVVQWVTSAFSEGRQAELLDPVIASSGQTSLGSIEKLLHVAVLCTQTNPDQRLDLNEAIRMIEEIQIELEEDPESQSQARTTTMQVLPSLRDGFADATDSNSSSFREDHV